MQFYVADYLADTGHLTTEEHGAYLLLIFNYWQTGKPLRKDRLSTVARLSNDRWILVERALKEFFHDNGETWAHFRIEGDLVAVQESVDKASKAGKASAAARQRKKELKDNARSTRVQQTLNECSTDVPTPTQPSDQSKADQITLETLTENQPESGKPDPCPHQAIVDLYNKKLPELPGVRDITERRKTALRARWRSHERFQDLSWWASYFELVSESDFLMGRLPGKTWRADFDFLIKPDKFQKIIELGYQNG